MSQLAVGIIETIGLAACIEAADACVKSANVKLIGYELSKGGGMAVLKVEGDVGAVKAAIDAATVAANKVSKVFSTKVIPRPSQQIDLLIKNQETVGYSSSKNENDEVEELEFKEKEAEEKEFKLELIKNIDKINEDIENENENIDDKVETMEEIVLPVDLDVKNEYKLAANDNLNFEQYKENLNIDSVDYTCNICKDPKCSREKGDLRTNCIHYNELNEN